MALLKKQYILDGLCCGNCASKIENEINTLNGVSAANLDFTSKILTIEYTDPEISETLSKKTALVAKKHDSDIVIKEKSLSEQAKKSIYIKGLDCAECAKKIEAAVNQIEGVKSASLDFVSQKLSIEAFDSNKLPGLSKKAAEIIKEIEPDSSISFTGNGIKDDSGSHIKNIQMSALIAGVAVFLICVIFKFPEPVELGLFLTSYLLIGGKILLRSIKNILRGQIFDENFLMSIATAGAFTIGNYSEGVAVMIFYQVGEFFQDLAVNRSRKSISALMDIRPDYANLKTGNEVRKVSPEEVKICDTILVRPGEKVPLDGKVIEGTSSLDTSALTGESLPRDVEPGSDILSGSVNKNGLLLIETTREFGESAVVKILDLVQNASSKKAPTENFITKFAKYYTPFVVLAALLLAVIPPLVLSGASFSDWINRALTFLVVSCPCALVISIPLSFFGGIGAASKNGILIKGSSYLEALNNVDTVVFDKTGTLTKGNFKVSGVYPVNGFSEDELLLYAAYAENFSNHPIAVSIREAFGKEINTQMIEDYEEISGHGTRVMANGKNILAGNSKLMALKNIEWQAQTEFGTVVYIAVDNVFAGFIRISDEIKTDSKAAIQNLKASGVKHTVMLTGDSKTAGEKAAKDIGIDTVYTELLPQQKVEQTEKLFGGIAAGKKLVFVGDGINDAPVLARADIGVAMGGLGSDAAIEAADVVLMTDEPSKLVTAINIAKNTRSIVWQNIIFALGVKLIILVLAAFGIATMWEAVFGDVGVTVIAVLNAIRTAYTNH